MSSIASLGNRAASLAGATHIARMPRGNAVAGGGLDMSGDAERLTRRNLRRAAEDLVAQAFVMPVLEQLRDTNHAAKPFGTSDAEKRLGPVIDGHVAHSLVHRARFDIVDRVETTILRRAGLAPESPKNGGRS